MIEFAIFNEHKSFFPKRIFSVYLESSVLSIRTFERVSPILFTVPFLGVEIGGNKQLLVRYGYRVRLTCTKCLPVVGNLGCLVLT